MNLGALCRTAEVFRLQQLVVPSLTVVENREFQKLAVSAHRWQPLAECSLKNLGDWIEHQRCAGIQVIALTRHPQAISLPIFRFPLRSALVMGRELTGIPPEIIACCQGAVEIPQFGQVDSLNVHTAAAIAAYAYISQHS